MKKIKWILIVFLTLGIIGAAFGDDTEKKDTPSASFSDTQELSIDTEGSLPDTEKNIPETEIPGSEIPETELPETELPEQPQIPLETEEPTEIVSDDTRTPSPTNDAAPKTVPETAEEAPVPETSMVWLSATGEKYHSIPNCGRMNPNTATQITLDDAVARGYSPCSKCH